MECINQWWRFWRWIWWWKNILEGGTCKLQKLQNLFQSGGPQTWAWIHTGGESNKTQNLEEYDKLCTLKMILQMMSEKAKVYSERKKRQGKEQGRDKNIANKARISITGFTLCTAVTLTKERNEIPRTIWYCFTFSGHLCTMQEDVEKTTCERFHILKDLLQLS